MQRNNKRRHDYDNNDSRSSKHFRADGDSNFDQVKTGTSNDSQALSEFRKKMEAAIEKNEPTTLNELLSQISPSTSVSYLKPDQSKCDWLRFAIESYPTAYDCIDILSKNKFFNKTLTPIESICMLANDNKTFCGYVRWLGRNPDKQNEVNAPSKKGNSLLNFLILKYSKDSDTNRSNKYLPRIQVLLDTNADLELKNNWNQTPLQLAIKLNLGELVDLFNETKKQRDAKNNTSTSQQVNSAERAELTTPSLVQTKPSMPLVVDANMATTTATTLSVSPPVTATETNTAQPQATLSNPISTLSFSNAPASMFDLLTVSQYVTRLGQTLTSEMQAITSKLANYPLTPQLTASPLDPRLGLNVVAITAIKNDITQLKTDHANYTKQIEEQKSFTLAEFARVGEYVKECSERRKQDIQVVQKELKGRIISNENSFLEINNKLAASENLKATTHEQSIEQLQRQIETYQSQHHTQQAKIDSQQRQIDAMQQQLSTMQSIANRQAAAHDEQTQRMQRVMQRFGALFQLGAEELHPDHVANMPPLEPIPQDTNQNELQSGASSQIAGNTSVLFTNRSTTPPTQSPPQAVNPQQEGLSHSPSQS